MSIAADIAAKGARALTRKSADKAGAVAGKLAIKTSKKVTQEQADALAHKLDSYFGKGQITKLSVKKAGPNKFAFKGKSLLKDGIQWFKGIFNLNKDHMNKLETGFKRVDPAAKAAKAAKKADKASEMFMPVGDLNHQGGVVIGSDFST